MQKLPLTENELRLIILEVRKYFCIWDRNHDNYDDKEAVAEAWTIISKAVNCDGKRKRQFKYLLAVITIIRYLGLNTYST